MYLSSEKKKKYILEILTSQAGKFMALKELSSQILSLPEFPTQIPNCVPEKIFFKELKYLVSENLIRKLEIIRISNMESEYQIRIREMKFFLKISSTISFVAL